MNSSELISALKLHGSFPSSNDLFSDQDYLSLYQFCMMSDIVPMMMKLNEEYFLGTKTYALTSSNMYRIAKRAIGTKLRDLKVLDSSGNATPLTRLYEEDRGSGKSGFYVVRNSIELSSDYTSGTLSTKFFIRPSKIVLTTDCAQIESIDSNNNQVVVSSVPTTFANGTVVDLVQNNNPYDLLDMDASVVSIAGTTVELPSIPDGLEVGDWICLAQQSPVPMVPEEMHPVLVQSALCKALSSKKDKAYDTERKELDRMKEDAINMLDPRIENNSNKVQSGKLVGYFARNRFFR